MTRKKTAESAPRETAEMLCHWHDAIPNDRLAHLAKDATRALQMRLAEHAVSFGHWTFLRILWETDGLTQRELSVQVGVMKPTTPLLPSRPWRHWVMSSVSRCPTTRKTCTSS